MTWVFVIKSSTLRNAWELKKEWAIPRLNKPTGKNTCVKLWEEFILKKIKSQVFKKIHFPPKYMFYIFVVYICISLYYLYALYWPWSNMQEWLSLVFNLLQVLFPNYLYLCCITFVIWWCLISLLCIKQKCFVYT